MPSNKDNNELDEIIAELLLGHYSWAHDQLDGTSLIDDEIKLADERGDKAKQQLLAWRDRAVMEELENMMLNPGCQACKHNNELQDQLNKSVEDK